MHPRLKANLHDAIDTWIAANCESTEWEAADFVCGAATAEYMTDAAIAVFDALIEAQHHGKQQGLLAEPVLD